MQIQTTRYLYYLPFLVVLIRLGAPAFMEANTNASSAELSDLFGFNGLLVALSLKLAMMRRGLLNLILI